MSEPISVTVDFFEFDELQLTLVHSLAEAIARELKKGKLENEQVRELTTQILFSVTSYLDGIVTPSGLPEGISPFLTFARSNETTDLLATMHGTGMTEYAVGCAEDVFDDEGFD